MELRYQLEFFCQWHAGSGLTGSTYADALVIKDALGLPYVPGKTIKGLLREGAESIHSLQPGKVTHEFIRQVFGEAPTKEQLDSGISTEESKCFFSNARLDRATVQKLVTDSEKAEKDNPAQLISSLYRLKASTAIESNGLAKEGSLRQMEVTIPITLFGSISGFPDAPEYQEQIAACAAWVKRLGQNRNRGLGRCQISILN